MTQLSLSPMTRGSRDAALLVRLAPGRYTVRTTGKSTGWERAELEAFLINNSPALKASLALTPVGIARSTRGDLPALSVGHCSTKAIVVGTDGTVSNETSIRPAASKKLDERQNWTPPEARLTRS